MREVVITGAGGFIGSELTRKYVDEGYRVIAVSLSFNSTFPDSNQIIKVQMDLDDPKKILEIIPKSEYEAFFFI